MNNDEKYIKGYKYWTDELGNTRVTLKFIDGTWDDRYFKMFTKDENFDFERLPIIGLTKAEADHRIFVLRQASVGVILDSY